MSSNAVNGPSTQSSPKHWPGSLRCLIPRTVANLVHYPSTLATSKDEDKMMTEKLTVGRDVLDDGVAGEETAEILTHAALYAGCPKAWAAFSVAQDVYTD